MTADSRTQLELSTIGRKWNITRLKHIIVRDLAITLRGLHFPFPSCTSLEGTILTDVGAASKYRPDVIVFLILHLPSP